MIILNECVGYIEIFENNRANILPFKDSAFNHLKKIMSYLTSNIDEKTHCLKALYGDWNDALDGLGKIKGKITEFGNGVSIMATFQLYSSLTKFIEIVKKYNNDNEYIEQLVDCRNTILNGIKKNAFVEKNNEFKSFLIELQKIRKEINEKLKNTDYHAIITYSSWW